MPRIFYLFLGILCLLLLVAAQNDTTTQPVFPHDPFLEFRPPFARSLPVQILLTGIVLTLVVVLFIHLVFTAQYHWPLAPVNYVLQISGVTTLLISLIATIHVVLSSSFAESEKWPYMLSYIAVNVPPLGLDDDDSSDDWSIAERATWLVMNASTSGLIQITHIQFLTLLYPSRLEARLIFFLLGPLAIVAAIMQLIPIFGTEHVNEIASAVKNVCNATLSLLFTGALFIWGLLVNRRQAWRTDGGTAVFGASALTLALVSTALNLLYVDKEEEYVWLPGLMWAVILWQSFLGWWWWVGAGSGTGLGMTDEEEMEEKLRREAKRESRKREAKERRQVKKNRAKKVWKGMAGALSRDGEHENDHEGHTTSVRARSQGDTEEDTGHSGSHRRHRHRDSETSPPSTSPHTRSSPQGSPSPSMARSVASTATSVYSFITLPRVLPTIIHRWYASLRRAHRIAARQQAVERVERIRELGARETGRTGNGWGLGSFGWRVGQDRRLRERERVEREKRAGVREGEEVGSENEMDSDIGRRRRSVEGQRVEVEMEEGLPHRREYRPYEHEEGNIEDRIPIPKDSQAAPPNIPNEARPGVQPVRPRSLWWWGPLFRWRLQDSTVY